MYIKYWIINYRGDSWFFLYLYKKIHCTECANNHNLFLYTKYHVYCLLNNYVPLQAKNRNNLHYICILMKDIFLSLCVKNVQQCTMSSLNFQQWESLFGQLFVKMAIFCHHCNSMACIVKLNTVYIFWRQIWKIRAKIEHTKLIRERNSFHTLRVEIWAMSSPKDEIFNLIWKMPFFLVACHIKKC